jgi:DNA helicase II / ATP-dependent DNA helicase PcrA
MVESQSILAGLNPEQREAALATRGPVAILAGAGTGKTTTITHRIAYQVATGAFRPGEILAVTFTERAAGELRARLRALGVDGVEARTFHSAALSQLSRLWLIHAGTPLGDVLDSKAPLIASFANALPPPHRFVPRRDLATEIEWAKNRRIGPERYPDELVATGHVPPIPADLMHRVYDGYERRKRRMERLDFEDMLDHAVRLFDVYPQAAQDVRAKYAAFTVDEYQDVNPLQAALLVRWLGDRDDVCVVGDDYQSIYGFTGASPEHLLGFARRFPSARLVRLEENYRSTPQILETANRLAARLGGFRKSLRSTRPAGPAPVIRAIASESAEADMVMDEVRRLHSSEGISYEHMAVLYRINARSEPFEEAFARARIPYQVRDGVFLRRPGPRAALHRLSRETGPPSATTDRVTAALGFLPEESAPDSPEEATRQADLVRLRTLAREFEGSQPDGGAADFVADLIRRFSIEESGRGVNLMTYHRAKGLEFDAVFLPRLLDGELPFRSGRYRAPIDEERRLLYVGITRARRWLFLSWPIARPDGRAAHSPFIDELSPAHVETPARGRGSRQAAPAGSDRASRVLDGDPLLAALKRWRLERARRDGVPAYVVFHDATLAAIADRHPRTRAELLGVSGVGPAKLKRYGHEVLATVAAAGTIS